MPQDEKEMLKKLWMSGVEAVRGHFAVQNELRRLKSPAPNLIIAVGKAAGDMALGARSHFAKPIPTIVATKYDHVREELAKLSQCEIYEAAHPIPDNNSLIAGSAILSAVTGMKSTEHLLLLVSGGASSLVEVLQPGIDLDDLAELNQAFMAQGLDIHEINTERQKISQIKAGKLMAAFSGKAANIIAISDVEGDSIDIIGSGIGAYHGNNAKIKVSISGSNAVARMAISDSAREQNLPVIDNQESLYGNAEKVAAQIFERIDHGLDGLYIFGGEPTCILPENPGRGGRNQHLGLCLANMIRERNDLTILVAGTDGSDGPTLDAGALVDGQTVAGDVTLFIDGADAGTYLAERDALLTTGPTGTNVMDIMLVWKTSK